MYIHIMISVLSMDFNISPLFFSPRYIYIYKYIIIRMKIIIMLDIHQVYYIGDKNLR